jgi:uncharacterized protein (TIGR03086 family)
VGAREGGAATTTRGDDRAVFERAGALFTQRVHEVLDTAWTAPTPCDGWNVRDLVNHLVAEHRWVPDLLGGATVGEVGTRHDGDVVGSDPVGAWDSAWARSSAVWADVDEDGIVGLSRGPTPVGSYREEMIVDLVVHGWDLSRGAGLREIGDRTAVRRALEIASEQVDGWSGSDFFDQPVSVDTDDPLIRLVALLGRQP